MDETRVVRLELTTRRHDPKGARAEARSRDGVETAEQLIRLLSRRNMELLELIRTAEPRSVAELARLSGRPKASLMITLRRMQRLGLITFQERESRRKKPVVACDRLRLDVVIGPGKA